MDNIGGQHDYRGALKDGNMVFMGDRPAPNGQRGRVPTRLATEVSIKTAASGHLRA